MQVTGNDSVREGSQIRDLRKRKIKLEDQGPGLITQELLCSKVLLKYKKGLGKLPT